VCLSVCLWNTQQNSLASMPPYVILARCKEAYKMTIESPSKYLLALNFTISGRPTQPPIQWVPGIKRGRGVTQASHLHLVPRLRMSRSYTLLSHSASMASSGKVIYTKIFKVNINESKIRGKTQERAATVTFCVHFPIPTQ
jgi:hypothetical protein